MGHPMGSRLYRFIPFLDEKCQWHNKSKKVETRDFINSILTTLPKNITTWFIEMVLDYTFGTLDYDGFLDLQKKSKKKKNNSIRNQNDSINEIKAIAQEISTNISMDEK